MKPARQWRGLPFSAFSRVTPITGYSATIGAATHPTPKGRMDPHWQNGITITPDAEPIWQDKSRSLCDTFKMFYGDTAMFGGQAASQCGLAFFGAEHSAFATDYPFDHEEGSFVICETIGVVDALDCSAEDRRQIYEAVPKLLLG